jgi:hypothetical protein
VRAGAGGKKILSIRTFKKDTFKQNLQKDTFKQNLQKNTFKQNLQKNTFKQNLQKDTFKQNLQKDTFKQNLQKDIQTLLHLLYFLASIPNTATHPRVLRHILDASVYIST